MISRPHLAAMAAIALTVACQPGPSAVDPSKVTELTVALSDLEKRVKKLEDQVKGMEPPALTMPVNLPDWVADGSRVDPEKPNLIIGVGQASGITNATLARSSANEDAKRAILSIIREEFELTGKGKAARTTLTAVTVTGVKFTQHWEHPDGTTFALGELNIEAYPQLGIKPKVAEPADEDGDGKAAAGDGEESSPKSKAAADGKKRKKAKRKKSR